MLRLRRKDEARVAIEFWNSGEYATYLAGPVPAEVWDARDAKYLEMRQLKGELTGRPRHSIVSRNLADQAAAS